MKKIAIACIIIFTLNIFGISAMASGTVTIYPVAYDAENNSIVVSGCIDDTRDRIPMTLHISSGDTIIAAGETLAVGLNESGVPYEFEPVYLGYGTPSGEFTITVSAGIIKKSASVQYTYKGVDKQYEAMIALNASIKANDDVQYVSNLHTYSDVVGIDIISFDNLNDTAEDVAVGSLMAHEYTLPDDYDTLEECLVVQQAIKSFSAHFREAMVLGNFFNASNISQLKSWYEANKAEYSLLLDDEDTVPDESKMVEYFEGILKTENYLARRSYMTSVLTVKELHPIMKHQAILQTIEDSGQYAVKKVVGDFKELLTYLDYTAWNSLKDTDKKTTACISVAGKSYSSIELFCDAVDTAVAKALADKDGGGSIGFGGSGGSSGATSGSSNEKNSVTVSTDSVIPVAKPLADFSDMDASHWAWDAIRYLYSEGIISGNGDGTFAPSNYVTRAELAKMITKAFKLTSSGNAPSFADVDSSQWYASYVMAAAEQGIVLGDDNGNFNPTGLVTRQDTAVMLYRAIGNPDSATQAYFEDYSYISDYAQSAVDYMYANGVVNGVGDGMFAPKTNLTRAEAAKMLYLIII